MKIANDNSINTLLAQKQSQSNGILSTGFSSLLNQNSTESDKEKEESSSKNLNNQLQFLQNKAYLNKAA
ncbi:MAG: hypothetical protein U9Q04_00960, partial [Campylobacterota bacterium]|nr:hypothetical protein [Campylobacterota bacterium]